MSELSFLTGETPAIDGQPMPIALGQCRIRCPIFYFHLPNPQTLELGAMVSQIAVSSYDKVLLDGNEVYPTAAGGVQIELRKGDETTPYRSQLLTLPSWISHLPGCAWIAMRIDLGVAKISGAIPTIEADVHGALYSSSFTENPVRFLQILCEQAGQNVVTTDFDAAATAITRTAVLALQNSGRISRDDPAVRALLDYARCEMYIRAGGTLDETAWTIVRMDAPTSIGTAGYLPSHNVRLIAPPRVTFDSLRMPSRATGRFFDITSRSWVPIAAEYPADYSAQARQSLSIGDIPATSYQEAMRAIVSAINRARRKAQMWHLLADGSGEKAKIGASFTLSVPEFPQKTLQVIGQTIRADGAVEIDAIEYVASDWDNSTYTTSMQRASTSQGGTIRFYRDEFLGGGTGGGAPIGELGWQPTGTPAVDYGSEPGHDGTVYFVATQCTLPSISLASSESWSCSIMWKSPTPPSGANRYFLGVEIAHYGGTGSLIVGGTTIRTSNTPTWYEAIITHGAGATKANVTVRGADGFSWAGTAGLSSATPRLGEVSPNSAVYVDRVTIAKAV